VAEHPPATAPAAALQAVPIIENVAIVVVPKGPVPTAPAVEFVRLAAEAAFAPIVTASRPAALVMALHKALEQEMPVHDVTPIYLNVPGKDISKLYR
jgi:hypothetical protein